MSWHRTQKYQWSNGSALISVTRQGDEFKYSLWIGGECVGVFKSSEEAKNCYDNTAQKLPD